jgi:hypothetical protein
MARKPSAPDNKPKAPQPTAPLLADAIYTARTAAAALGVSLHAFRREVWQGKVRFSRRLGRNFIHGRWLLDWLGEGQFNESRERRPAPNEAVPGNGPG